ncbi:hypothetical protein CCAX7_45090 [Capsulimonas corticalis]|uniref:Uncharacterized protein n=1 Tax=Capsulimonas corticalis TaxID=2219043 RepID=A0A402D6H4_9BACT|nr:hypothetical protein CCAX7_45090 [Capsulimonas corticalis]
MRVIVDPPEVFFAVVGVWAVTQDFPIRNAVDGVRVGLLVRLLKAAPDEVLDVILDGVDLALIGIVDVFCRDIPRFAERGVVAGDGVGPQAVQIVRTAQDLTLHVPLGKEAVVPLGGIAVLLVRN